MENGKNFPEIALGTWFWGVGAVGGAPGDGICHASGAARKRNHWNLYQNRNQCEVQFGNKTEG